MAKLRMLIVAFLVANKLLFPFAKRIFLPTNKSMTQKHLLQVRGMAQQ
jgi:hypothetical protein